VVGVDELTVAVPLATLPHADVLGASQSVRVSATPVSDMVLPLPLVRVAVDVEVLAEAAALVLYPTTCLI
jgi:hypothetical protein